MSATDASAIAAWNSASAAINHYFSIFIFLFGMIGNILNVLVLSKRTLRNNPCSFLFLVSSLANLIAFLSGLAPRMLYGWTFDPSNAIDWLCQLRVFLLYASRHIAAWLILLATIDRWLLSNQNVRRRQLSTLKNAYRGIITTIIFSIILYGPIFYCYQANLINAPLPCYGKSDLCRLTNDLSYACLTILIPIVSMIIFGLMTINNIHQVKSRVHPIVTIELHPTQNVSTVDQPTQAAKKKLDSRLFLMLFIQILFLSLFTLPQSAQKLYSTLTANQILSPLRIAINNFISSLVVLLTFLANGMSFYIYTLSGGTIFRNAFKETMQQIGRKILPIH